MSKVLKGVARAEALAAFVLAAIAEAPDALAASVLPAIRAGLAADPRFGGDASLYYGTADRVYFRAVGEANPLPSDGATNRDGSVSAKFARALAARRNEGGTLARWDVLAASASVALGRKVATREAKALYDRAGWDREFSYIGRGTRAGAEATRLAGDAARTS